MYGGKIVIQESSKINSHVSIFDSIGRSDMDSVLDNDVDELERYLNEPLSKISMEPRLYWLSRSDYPILSRD